jgi:YOP proteins translocation protein K (YscK)
MGITFLKHVARRNRPLFVLLNRFNYQPARYIHADHLAGLTSPQLLERLRRSPRGQHKLSRWISERWGLDAPDVGEFEDKPRRLALLEYTALERLVTLIGAAVYSRRIALAVDRDTQVRMKQSLGDDYLFAVKRAQFLVKDLPERLAGPLGPDPRRQLREAGSACVLGCFPDASRALRQRLALKFPPGAPLDCGDSLNDSERASVWKSLKRILVSEVNPAVAPCFN